MKSKNDPRHQRRIQLVQALFAWGVTGNIEDLELTKIISQIPSIDQKISVAAPKWPIDQINKVELAILRLAVWELENKKDIPPKVVIDEAIEISKEFCDTSSSSFVNAVLGTILKENGQN